jgi:cell wall assembly regulator SMI1
VCSLAFRAWLLKKEVRGWRRVVKRVRMTGRQAQMMPTEGSTKARVTAVVSSPGWGVG